MKQHEISAREMRLAESVMAGLQESFSRRNLTPAFSEFYVARFAGTTPLIAVLDTAQIGDHRRYVGRDLCHQLSTDLGGLPVYLSNHSGIRYVVLLAPLPKLPRRVDFPVDAPSGKLAIGQRFTGQPVIVSWEDFTHLAVLGTTGSGKSMFLQGLVYQAIRDGMQLMISDMDRTTFGMLAGHPSLAAAIAKTPEQTALLIGAALQECERRANLFEAMPGNPQKLSEYNALAERSQAEALPRMLVVVDEASTVLERLGGAKGEISSALAEMGWRGRKFGVHFIFAAQEFTKAVLGPVRSQVGLSLCFRVGADAKQMAARMGCTGAERIPEGRKGLAISSKHGPVQAYYFDLSLFGTPRETAVEREVIEACDGQSAQPLSEEQRLAESIRARYEPGMSKSEVSRLLNKPYAGQSWIAKVEKVIAFLSTTTTTTTTTTTENKVLTPGIA